MVAGIAALLASAVYLQVNRHDKRQDAHAHVRVAVLVAGVLVWLLGPVWGGFWKSGVLAESFTKKS